MGASKTKAAIDKKTAGLDSGFDERPSAQSFLLAQRRTLEMIADGADLTEILEELCRTIDAQQPDVISTVLLADEDGKNCGLRLDKAVCRADRDRALSIAMRAI